MGRRPRQFASGGIYHIVQRGHNRSYIFNEQTDKSSFLDMIKEAGQSMPFHLLYYVLMDNHYHLIVQMDTAPLDKVLHAINLAYSKFFNKKYHCSGTVYGERYRAFPVTDTAYLLKLILYIANNPVKAGLVKHPAEYRWCAHMEIVSNKGGVVSASRLFDILGGSDKNDMTAFEQGARSYDQLIRQNFLPVSQAPSPSAFISERRSDQLETLLHQMLHERFGDRLTIGQLRSGSRDPEILRFRNQFVRAATKHGYKTVEIARLLNCSDRTVRAIRSQVELPNGHSGN